MYDESWSGISGGFPPCARALSIASNASRPSGAPTDTMSAPVLLSSERRENEAGLSNFVMAAPPQPIIVAARLTALRMLTCVPHRHLRPSSACLISASDGLFFSARKIAAVMIQPLIQ